MEEFYNCCQFCIHGKQNPKVTYRDMKCKINKKAEREFASNGTSCKYQRDELIEYGYKLWQDFKIVKIKEEFD